METKTQHGYLLIADISGYSSFVAKSELEHAHDILTELLELILNRLTTLLTLSKLEGDAVFAYVPESKLTHRQNLLNPVNTASGIDVLKVGFITYFPQDFAIPPQ